MWSLNSLGSRVTRYRYHITDKRRNAGQCPCDVWRCSYPLSHYTDSALVPGARLSSGRLGRPPLARVRGEGGAARTDAQHPSVVRADARVAAPPLTTTLGPANSASLTAGRPPSPHRPRHSADQSNCCHRSFIIHSCCGRFNIQPG